MLPLKDSPATSAANRDANGVPLIFARLMKNAKSPSSSTDVLLPASSSSSSSSSGTAPAPVPPAKKRAP